MIREAVTGNQSWPVRLIVEEMWDYENIYSRKVIWLGFLSNKKLGEEGKARNKINRDIDLIKQTYKTMTRNKPPRHIDNLWVIEKPQMPLPVRSTWTTDKIVNQGGGSLWGVYEEFYKPMRGRVGKRGSREEKSGVDRKGEKKSQLCKTGWISMFIRLTPAPVHRLSY